MEVREKTMSRYVFGIDVGGTTVKCGLFDLEGNVLFLCDSMEDVGLENPAIGPEHLCTGPRIGVDYAEEARDFPWRFWLEKEI